MISNPSQSMAQQAFEKFQKKKAKRILRKKAFINSTKGKKIQKFSNSNRCSGAYDRVEGGKFGP